MVERANLERPGFFEGAVDSIENGVEARVTQSLPMRMIIADRELGTRAAVLRRPGDQGGGALLIHPSGLLDALQTMFDLVWQSASRLVVSSDGVGEDAGDVLEDVDAQVLGLLLAGLTDQAIGNQLGLSLAHRAAPGQAADGPGSGGDPAAARSRGGTARVALTGPARLS